MLTPNQFNPSSQDNDESTSINIQERVAKYLYHWPVFILGILICLLVGYIYLRYAQPVYLVESTLLIKDDEKAKLPAAGDILNDINLFGSSKIVDNEIEILKSRTLMRKVVDRLNLSTRFLAVGRFKNSDLYSNKFASIQVVQMDSVLYGSLVKLSFPSSLTYQLEDERSGKIVKGKLNELQRNAFGVYKINQKYNSQKVSSAPVYLAVEDPEDTVDRFLKLLEITLINKQSSVLKLSMKAIIPERGKDIINTLIQVYNEAALSEKNRTTLGTIEFIDERLKLITGELTEVEKDVEGFKSSRGLTDISSDANIFLENVRTNDLKLNEVNLQISVIADIRRYLNSDTKNEKLPSILGINDPVVLGQITQLGELQLQRDQLLTTTTERNPLLEPLNKQIETTRSGINASIDNIFKALMVSKADLERNNLEFQGSIKKIPGQERELISIKRQQTIKESLYLYLLQKKEEAELSYASVVADSRIVDAAHSSKFPQTPKRQLVLLACLIGGTLLVVVYLYLKELFNNKVEGITNFRKLSSVPVIGEIIFSEGANHIVVDANSRTAVAEQFRSIRTNMQFLHANRSENEGVVTLFTSGMSGEGKTFVATNLAMALALSGKKTVLLELDLRKPKVSKYLDIVNRVGLSNYLIGQLNCEDIIETSLLNPNLYIISSGPIPPNPSELLSHDGIERLIQYLRKHFDEILIDSPPIGLVTDAQILARVADSTFYLVREGVTFKEQVKNLDRLSKTMKFPKLNVIFNGIRMGGTQGYGYGYGYYSEDLTNQKVSFKSLYKNIIDRF